MVQGFELRLRIGACAHLGGRADQNADSAAAYLGKEFILLCFGIGVMDESNLFSWNSAADELAPVSYTHLVRDLHQKPDQVV